MRANLCSHKTNDSQKAPRFVEKCVNKKGSFVVAGVLGSAGHYCWTRAFHAADISSLQSARFLDLVWASALGWLIFSDIPSQTTWIGAVVILATTLWIARREGQQAAKGLLDDPSR
jgi:uncharacterized membrane protein